MQNPTLLSKYSCKSWWKAPEAKRSAQRRSCVWIRRWFIVFTVPRTNIRTWKLMARAPKRRGWSRVVDTTRIKLQECSLLVSRSVRFLEGMVESPPKKKLWPLAMDYIKPLEMFTMVRTLIPSTSRSRTPNSVKVDGPKAWGLLAMVSWCQIFTSRVD